MPSAVAVTCCPPPPTRTPYDTRDAYLCCCVVRRADVPVRLWQRGGASCMLTSACADAAAPSQSRCPRRSTRPAPDTQRCCDGGGGRYPRRNHAVHTQPQRQVVPRNHGGAHDPEPQQCVVPSHLMSRTDEHPARSIACTNSRLSRSSTWNAPASPLCASPHSMGRPTNTARAPRASACGTWLEGRDRTRARGAGCVKGHVAAAQS